MIELNLGAAVAELVVAGAALGLLVLGVFRQPGGTRAGAQPDIVFWLSTAALVLAGLISAFSGGQSTAFGGVFIDDAMARYAKMLIYLATAAALVLSRGYMGRIRLLIFEFPVLMLFAALGMAMMVSANDMIALYMGLELQSLSLYVLASLRRDSALSTEAGLKYFVLGALSSGLLLFGMSFVYGYAGGTSFAAIAAATDHTEHLGVGLLIGLSLMLAGLGFKISAAPFHMWTPDVYQGAPTPITAFFAGAPKVAAGVLMLRVLHEGFGGVAADWGQIVALLAAASMLLGGIAAIGQTSIKRLMAYSSIGHMGFALMGLAAGTATGVEAMLVYLGVYVLMNVGVFAFILSMRRGDEPVSEIADLAGLARTDILAAAAMAALLFSLAGIPPLAGFFAKLYVFRAAADAGLIWLLVIAAVATVISAFYYLRLIKLMFFDDPAPAFDRARFDLRVALGLSALAMIVFVIGGLGLTGFAATAASALAG